MTTWDATEARGASRCRLTMSPRSSFVSSPDGAGSLKMSVDHGGEFRASDPTAERVKVVESVVLRSATLQLYGSGQLWSCFERPVRRWQGDIRLANKFRAVLAPRRTECAPRSKLEKQGLLFAITRRECRSTRTALLTGSSQP